MGHFCPPGSGSTDPIESGSNSDPDPDTDPDPQPCFIDIWSMMGTWCSVVQAGGGDRREAGARIAPLQGGGLRRRGLSKKVIYCYVPEDLRIRDVHPGSDFFHLGMRSSLVLMTSSLICG